MYSLFCRRQLGDLIEVGLFLNGYYNVDATFFTLSVTSTRGHHMKLFKSHNNTRANFFAQRVINNCQTKSYQQILLDPPNPNQMITGNK